MVTEIWPSKSFILRSGWFYGPFGKNFAKTITKRAPTLYETIDVVSNQYGKPTSSIDIAKRIIEVINSKVTPGIYHATNSGETSWWNFARELFSLSGVSPEKVNPIQAQELSTSAKRPEYSVLEHSMLNKVGVLPIRNWRDALTEIYPRILSEVEDELRNV